jgi:hypothetical protein
MVTSTLQSAFQSSMNLQNHMFGMVEEHYQQEDNTSDRQTDHFMSTHL